MTPEENEDHMSAAGTPNHTHSELLSVMDFLKTDQTKAPNSPRSLDACGQQGVLPEELIQIPYEELTGASDRERRMRFDAREKRRKGYLKEVTGAYRKMLAEKRPGSLPDLDSVRSQMATDRKARVDSVVSREQKNLARHERVMADSLHKSLSEQHRADLVEAKYQQRLEQIEGKRRRQYKQREEANVCRSVWRRSKLDRARDIAAADLERHANLVLSKEHARILALQNKEMEQAALAEKRRQEHKRRADVVAKALSQQEQQKQDELSRREEYDEVRQAAYESSLNRRKVEAELRGKQKDVVTVMKREKVRLQEREFVEHHLQCASEKEMAFERRKAKLDEKRSVMTSKREQWEQQKQERQHQLRLRDEAKREELEQQLQAVEKSTERALARRDRQNMMKAVKYQLRSEELEAAQQKLARMEAHKQEQRLKKLELEEQQDRVLRRERLKEVELLQALKRQSVLAQKEIKKKAFRSYTKMRLTSASPVISEPES